MTATIDDVLTHGSLFTGIGGIDLGFERAGIETVWQVENNNYATKVLEKHWPAVRRWDDVRTFPPDDSWETPDIISGGFPCQDISAANPRGKGIDGARSGLFFSAIRVACELRPQFMLLENSPALLVRGISRVLGALAESGYDAEWRCVPASEFGAPHRRERLYILAYTTSFRRGCAREPILAFAQEDRQARWGFEYRRGASGRVFACPPPELFGVADGVSCRVDRLKCLGNAVVPQVAEWLGRRIVSVYANTTPPLFTERTQHDETGDGATRQARSAQGQEENKEARLGE